MDKKLSILIFSCDAYSDLWDNFFDCFEKFWRDNNYQCYLVNNFKKYQRSGVIVLNAGSGDWSSRAKFALDTVPSKYVLAFLEDYYLCDYVANSQVSDVVDYVIGNNVNYYQLDKTDKEDYFRWKIHDKKNYLFEIPKNRNYWVDTSVAIWEKSFFLQLLGDEDYSAWKFELDRNADAKHPERYADKSCLFDCRSLITVRMMVTQGKYDPDSLKLMASKFKKLETGSRSIMSTRELWRAKTIRFFSKMRYGRRLAKYLARKLGVKFVSDAHVNR
jgi:hypothetical protein